MGLPVPRGNIGGLVNVGQRLLGFSNSQFEIINYKSNINTGAHIAGSLIAQAELVSSSLKNIERCLVKESTTLKSSGISLKDLRVMIEEYGNLAKLVK